MKIYGGVLKGNTFRDQGYVSIGLVEYLDALDYSGSGTTWPARVGNSATLYGGPTWSDSGYFNFVPSSLQYADAPTLGDLGAWTVECWYNLQDNLASYNDPALISTVYDGTGKVNFTLTQGAGSGYTDTLCAGYYNGGDPGWHLTGTTPPTIGSWAQAVGTFDGTYINFYLNTTFISEVAGGGASSASGGALRIARRWDQGLNSLYLFPAEIAVVRIYNFALSPDQVIQNFNYERERFGL
jgi:hypothetical protein